MTGSPSDTRNSRGIPWRPDLPGPWCRRRTAMYGVEAKGWIGDLDAAITDPPSVGRHAIHAGGNTSGAGAAPVRCRADNVRRPPGSSHPGGRRSEEPASSSVTQIPGPVPAVPARDRRRRCRCGSSLETADAAPIDDLAHAASALRTRPGSRTVAAGVASSPDRRSRRRQVPHCPSARGGNGPGGRRRRALAGAVPS